MLQYQKYFYPGVIRSALKKWMDKISLKPLAELCRKQLLRACWMHGHLFMGEVFISLITNCKVQVSRAYYTQ